MVQKLVTGLKWVIQILSIVVPKSETLQNFELVIVSVGFPRSEKSVISENEMSSTQDVA